jgi:hypothetical protein
MKVLSLDIDGVLNRHRAHENGYCGIDPECVRWLNFILARVPDVQLLIHSAWRYMVIGGRMDLKGFEYMLLTHGVNCENRIIGHTESDSVRHRGPETKDADLHERAAQIAWAWGQIGRDAGVLVVVDDLPLNLKGFVQTDGAVGLTETDASRIVNLLRQQSGSAREASR